MSHWLVHMDTIGGWQRVWVVRTSVFGWRTFPDLRV